MAVACGALRPMPDGAIEVKRMFVQPEHRGRGWARAMLAELEKIALQRGYRIIRLGTGTAQPEAIGLYESAGYRPIPLYGEYAADDRSRCFEKTISIA
jgi:putative acetyltransferase